MGFTSNPVAVSGRLWPGVVILFVLLLASAAPVEADTTARINAVASATVPAGIAIAVAAKDGSERTAVLQSEIELALRKCGYVVDPQGPWQLQFATAVEILPRDRSILRLMGRVGSDSRADLGVEVPLPQWPGQASPESVYRYNVWMTLGQSGRPAIWQGAATAVGSDGESTAIEAALAAALLARFGETLADQPLSLP